MKSFSLVFRVTFNRAPEGLVLPDAPAIPYDVVTDFDRLECRIDVKPCNIASGDATVAPLGTLLLTWSTGHSVAIPAHYVRTIVIND